MRIRSYLFFLLFLPISSPAENDPHEVHYIAMYHELAVREMERSGIPASIKLAQGILESAWGKSSSALKYNSHFGIKCKQNWRGRRFQKEDDDYDAQGNLIKSCFRAYGSVEESYRDHTRFLQESARYEELFSFPSTDYVNWAIGLQRCGYATNKTYAIQLIDLIEKYELHRFDQAAPVVASTVNPLPEETLVPPPAVVLPDDYFRKQPEVALSTAVTEESQGLEETPVVDTPGELVSSEKLQNAPVQRLPAHQMDRIPRVQYDQLRRPVDNLTGSRP